MIITNYTDENEKLKRERDALLEENERLRATVFIYVHKGGIEFSSRAGDRLRDIATKYKQNISDPYNRALILLTDSDEEE